MSSRVAICVALLLSAVTIARAAPDAGSKARGEYNFYGHSVHSSLHSAHAHTQHYSSYLTHVQTPDTAAPVDPEVAKVVGDTIGTSISTMQRHLAIMRKHATTLGDKKSLGMLDDVERNLAEAKEHHEALQAAHGGETIDPKIAQQHVDKVNAALQRAKVEHDEVMEKIGAGP